MSENRVLETVGTITKRETLSSIEHDTNKALVLETKKPYPGYHGTTIPDQLNPMSLFFVTDKKYTGEKIIRATMAVKKEFDETFDAVPGLITVFNELTPCIRIKDLNSYDKVSQLIKLYRTNGVDFMKARKMERSSGLIKIRKYFELKKFDENLYKDLEIPEMAYFVIPCLLDWDVFESITENMKVNPKYNNFDAAIGVFFTPQGVVDTVRIFKKDIDIDEIKLLKSRYLQEISRLA